MFNQIQKQAMRQAVAKLIDVKKIHVLGFNDLVKSYRPLREIQNLLTEKAWPANNELMSAYETIGDAITYPEMHGYGDWSRQPVAERIDKAIGQLQAITSAE